MTSEPKLLTVREVEAPPPVVVPQKAPGVRRPPVLQGADLGSIQGRAGAFLVPSYVPAGFSLSYASSGPTDMVNLYYTRGLERLSLKQSTLPAHPYVGTDHARPATVAGHAGYLVLGGWVSLNGGPVGWAEDLALGLLWEQDGRWFELSVVPASALDQAELLHIAESLQPY